MSMHIPGRVVVFDYGEVISRSPSGDDTARVLAIADVEPDVFWPSYWRHRDALDRGRISPAQYWRLIEAEVATQWSLSTIHALWIADFRSWFSLEPGTLDLIGELHEGGTRLALLSNAGFDFAGPFRSSPMAECFERVFVSAELDIIKPDSAIYEHAASELGITMGEMVFIDNKLVNTDAAAALGATVHHYESVAGLRAFLDALAR